jgi:hypothetical protein
MGRPRERKRTIKQLYADLVGLGFDGSLVVSRRFPGVGGTIIAISSR